MIALGLETSCDETSVAVVRDGEEILSLATWTQYALHRPFGGVVPEVACRAHQERLLPLCRQALAEAQVRLPAIDLVGVTSQPGLIGALWVGLTAAKSLCLALGKPLVGVHHSEAHAYSVFLAGSPPPYPHVCLVVSGGHTLLFQASGPTRYELLGQTRDDAAGEAFDKVAALLNLPYPGGPALAKLAVSGNPKAVPFRRPLIAPDSLDFSFSGMKTAVRYLLHGQDTKHGPDRAACSPADLAASFQEAVVDTLVTKLVRAARQQELSHVALAGGVAANQRLREKLEAACQKHRLTFSVPPLRLCTDNAAMVAGLACRLYQEGRASSLDLGATPEF